MERIAVVGAILENPQVCQKQFNETVSAFRGIIKGRTGIPIDEENAAVISIVLKGELDEINALTGKLGNINGVTVKTAVTKGVGSTG